MAEPQFAHDDDLPRTLRREREAQREAREREQREAQMAAGPAGDGYPYRDHRGGAEFVSPPMPGVVNRFEVPFLHLTAFFMKAVIAAIPALILLTLILYAGGQVLKAFAPGFRHFEIVIRTPESPTAAPPAAKASEPVKPGAPAKK